MFDLNLGGTLFRSWLQQLTPGTSLNLYMEYHVRILRDSNFHPVLYTSFIIILPPHFTLHSLCTSDVK